MDSFELYKIALNQWNKAMEYHNNIEYEPNIRGRKNKKTKSYREREIQKKEYEKAIFYYKLYENFAKLEEREIKNEQ